jgi:hypothetical protein
MVEASNPNEAHAEFDRVVTRRPRGWYTVRVSGVARTSPVEAMSGATSAACRASKTSGMRLWR